MASCLVQLPQCGDGRESNDDAKSRAGRAVFLRDAGSVRAIGAKGIGAVAVGASAIVASTIGALAIGAIAIRAFTVKRSRIEHLNIEELEVGRLRVRELVIEQEQRPSTPKRKQGFTERGVEA
jgi:hypothetical protein